MGKQEKTITDKETVYGLLTQAWVGRMATVNKKGFPVIKPVNFVYRDGQIYFHSSRKGEKISDIRRGSRVCFEVDEAVAYAAAQGPSCSANYYYRSIIAKGKARLVMAKSKKLEILQRMMEKYQPEGGYTGIPDPILEKTAIIEISVEEMTGRENLG